MEKPFGLNITKRGLELKFNPQMIEEMDDGLIRSHIMHIVFHIASMHPARKEGRQPKKWGVATDLVVNQFVKIQGSLQPDEYKLPKDQSCETYYDKLPKMDEEPQQCEGEGEGGEGQEGEGEGKDKKEGGGKNETLDDHSGWNNVNPDIVKTNIISAIHNAVKKSRGTVPGEFQDIIDALFKETKIDWRDILRSFIAHSQTTTKIQTWKRPNRRFADTAGFKKKVFPKVLIGVDTSGSVGEEEQQQLINEVRNILGTQEAEIILAGYDTRVHTVLDVVKTDDDVRIPNTNGGTDFQCLNDLADDKEPDAIINLTDGGAPTPNESAFPYLWVYTKNHQPHDGYGESIILED
jgi:predicted metal-dependent peptidase